LYPIISNLTIEGSNIIYAYSLGLITLNKNNVKTMISKGQLASVRYKSTTINNEALQRLHAGDLTFAYLVGLIEGDGYFSITRNGKYCKYEFGIELHIRDAQLIYKLKELLGIGTVTFRNSEHRSKTIIYRVRNKSDLINIILPIFDKYPLLTNKQFDYIHFKTCLINNIVLHQELPIYTRPLLPYLNDKPAILNTPYFPAWLIGFIEAEGSFNIYLPTGRNVLVASFDIAQTNGESIIEAIGLYLFYKNTYHCDKTNCFKLKVSSVLDIMNMVNFMNKNPVKLMGHKRLQYILFLKELRQIPKYAAKFNIPDKY
jgi:hypothetical protein